MPGGLREGGGMTNQPRSAELAAQIKTLAKLCAEAQRRLALLRKERKVVLAAERRGKDG